MQEVCKVPAFPPSSVGPQCQASSASAQQPLYRDLQQLALNHPAPSLQHTNRKPAAAPILLQRHRPAASVPHNPISSSTSPHSTSSGTARMTDTAVPQHASRDALQQWIWKTAKAAGVELPIHPPAGMDTAFPADKALQQPQSPGFDILDTACRTPSSAAQEHASSHPSPLLLCGTAPNTWPGTSGVSLSVQAEGRRSVAERGGAEQLIHSSETPARGPVHGSSASLELAPAHRSGLDLRSAARNGCQVDAAAPSSPLGAAHAGNLLIVTSRLAPAPPCHSTEQQLVELGQEEMIPGDLESGPAVAAPQQQAGLQEQLGASAPIHTPATPVTDSKLLAPQEGLPMPGAHNAEQTQEVLACQVLAHTQHPSHKPATLSQLQSPTAPAADALDPADGLVHTAPATAGNTPDLCDMGDLQVSHSSHTQAPESVIQGLDARVGMLQPGEVPRLAGGLPIGQSQLGHVKDEVTHGPAPSVPVEGLLAPKAAAAYVQAPVPAMPTAGDRVLDPEADLMLEVPFDKAGMRDTPAGGLGRVVEQCSAPAAPLSSRAMHLDWAPCGGTSEQYLQHRSFPPSSYLPARVAHKPASGVGVRQPPAFFLGLAQGSTVTGPGGLRGLSSGMEAQAGGPRLLSGSFPFSADGAMEPSWRCDGTEKHVGPPQQQRQQQQQQQQQIFANPAAQGVCQAIDADVPLNEALPVVGTAGVLESGLWDAGFMQALVQKQQQLLQTATVTPGVGESTPPPITQQLRKLLQLYVGVMVLRQTAGSLLQDGTRVAQQYLANMSREFPKLGSSLCSASVTALAAVDLTSEGATCNVRKISEAFCPQQAALTRLLKRLVAQDPARRVLVVADPQVCPSLYESIIASGLPVHRASLADHTNATPPQHHHSVAARYKTGCVLLSSSSSSSSAAAAAQETGRRLYAICIQRPDLDKPFVSALVKVPAAGSGATAGLLAVAGPKTAAAANSHASLTPAVRHTAGDPARKRLGVPQAVSHLTTSREQQQQQQQVRALRPVVLTSLPSSALQRCPALYQSLLVGLEGRCESMVVERRLRKGVDVVLDGCSCLSIVQQTQSTHAAATAASSLQEQPAALPKHPQPPTSHQLADTVLTNVHALLLRLSLAFSTVLLIVQCTPGVEHHVTQRAGMLQVLAKSLGVRLVMKTSGSEATTQRLAVHLCEAVLLRGTEPTAATATHVTHLPPAASNSSLAAGSHPKTPSAGSPAPLHPPGVPPGPMSRTPQPSHPNPAQLEDRMSAAECFLNSFQSLNPLSAAALASLGLPMAQLLQQAVSREPRVSSLAAGGWIPAHSLELFREALRVVCVHMEEEQEAPPTAAAAALGAHMQRVSAGGVRRRGASLRAAAGVLVGGGAECVGMGGGPGGEDGTGGAASQL
ncbi:MAG: hypothetical protein WDW38_007736 [Sanguina aurantia]